MGGPFVVYVVDANGDNPFSADPRRSGQLDLEVQQGTVEPVRCDVASGVLSCDDELIDSYGNLTRIGAHATFGAGIDPLVGASPYFFPFFYPFLRLVVGPAGTCQELVRPQLTEDRVGGTLLTGDQAVNLVAIGGTTLDRSPSAGLDVVDLALLTWEGSDGYVPADGRPVEGGLTETRAIYFETTEEDLQPIFVLTSGGGQILRLAGDVTRTVVSGLHAGAGPDSTLLALGDRVAVIGGRTTGAGVADITIVHTDGTTEALTSALMVPRARPAVAVLSDGSILVGGGQPEGELSMELLSASTLRTVSTFGDTVQRDAPLFAVDGIRTSALLLGGRGAGGAPLTTTQLVTACGASCTVAPGPSWDRARVGPASVHRDGELLLYGGLERAMDGTDTPSRLVDRITWAPSGPQLQARGDLARQRAEGSAAHMSAGVVLVGGGRGLDGALRSLEICFPDATPL